MAASRKISDNKVNEAAAAAAASSSFLWNNLPYKIFQCITKFTDQSGLFALAQASRQFNEFVLIPGVHETIRCRCSFLQSENFYAQIVAPRGKFVRKLIVDDIITDRQVRRLLAWCPNLSVFKLKKTHTLFKVQKATHDQILSALADFCKQVKVVKVDNLIDANMPNLQNFANKCQLLTSLSDAGGPVPLLKILPMVSDNKWPRLAKITLTLNKHAVDPLLSLPITHLIMLYCFQCEELKSLLNRLPDLKHFEVQDYALDDDLDVVVNNLSTACKRLTSVKLAFIKWNRTVETLVSGCPMIEFADLKVDRTADESTLRIIGEGWKNLTFLKFEARFEMKTDNIFSSFRQCSQLHSVKFIFGKITDQILAANINCLPRHLQYFSLSCNSASDLTVEAMTKQLVNITNVTYSSIKFTSAACGHLSNMQYLTHLILNDAKLIDNQDIKKLAESSFAPKLQSLEFYVCHKLTGECFSWFTNFIKLRQLIVTEMNKVTDDAIQALTQCDEFCERLQHLEIVRGNVMEKNLGFAMAIVPTGFGFTDGVFQLLAKFTDLRVCKLGEFIQISDYGINQLFNSTKSPHLFNVGFTAVAAKFIRIPGQLIQSRLNDMGQAIDSYYETGFSN